MSRLLWGWQYHRCDVATGKQVYATTLDSRRAGGRVEEGRGSGAQTASKDCDEVTENGRHEMQMKLRQTLTLALALPFLPCLSLFLFPSCALSLSVSLSLCLSAAISSLAVLHMGRCSILHGAAWHILINWRAAHATCHMQHATIAKRAVSPTLPHVCPRRCIIASPCLLLLLLLPLPILACCTQTHVSSLIVNAPSAGRLPVASIVNICHDLIASAKSCRLPSRFGFQQQ